MNETVTLASMEYRLSPSDQAKLAELLEEAYQQQSGPSSP